MESLTNAEIQAMSAEQRVARGARLLDQRKPGWRDQLKEAGDFGPRAIVSCFDCVLGRLYGSYGHGTVSLGLPYDQRGSLGFSLDNIPRREGKSLLDDEQHLAEQLSWAWNKQLRSPQGYANQYVASGASLLDEKVEGWADKIDLEQFDIRNCYECILGQLFKIYFDGCDYLGLETATDKAQYGFTRGLGDVDWHHLSAAWRVEIEERRAGKEATNVE